MVGGHRSLFHLKNLQDNCFHVASTHRRACSYLQVNSARKTERAIFSRYQYHSRCPSRDGGFDNSGVEHLRDLCDHFCEHSRVLAIVHNTNGFRTRFSAAIIVLRDPPSIYKGSRSKFHDFVSERLVHEIGQVNKQKHNSIE